MGLFSKSKVEPEEEASPENAPDEMRKRGCTDCCCVVFFAAYMIGMLFLMYLAFTYGEPDSIFYGKDYLGNRCGVGGMWNRSKVIFPRIDRDVAEQAALASTAPWRMVFYGLCVHECPHVADPTACFGNPSLCMEHDYGTAEEQAAAGGRAYWFTVLPTIDVLNRCVPTKHVDASDAPDRCAYPVCDNVTNPWMVCDAEHPTLWLMTSLSDRMRCEIKFQHVEVDQLDTMEPSPLVERIADGMAFTQRLAEALVASWAEILGFGLGLSIAAGIAWLLLLRFFARVVVWLAVISFGALLAACTLYLFVTSGALNTLLAELAGNSTAGAGDGALANASAAVAAATASAESAILSFAPDAITEAANDAESSNPFLYQVGAWVLLLLTVLYLLMMCVARKKIRVAALLVKESTVVVKDRPSSLGLPLLVVALQVPLLVYLALGLVLISTANLDAAHFVGGLEGVLAKGASYADALAALNIDANASDAADAGSGGFDTGLTPPAESPWWVQPAIYIFFLFGVLWTLESVKNVGWTALSGNFSDWYFFRRDPKARSRYPLFRSLGRVVRYHLGSIFFGAFITALIKLMRILLALLDRATKGQQKANKTLKLVIKGLQLCMLCLEKTVKFVTDYCYVYVAMQGTGFCKSCFAVFKLIMGHPAQLALNTLIRTILVLIQLVGIPVGCAWLCNYVLESKGSPEPMYAAFAVALLAFIIAQAFASVMGCALDTLFVCCIRDKEEYNGAFMSDPLFFAFGFDKSARKERKAAKKAAKEGGKVAATAS